MARLDLRGPVWSNGSVPEGTVLGRPVGGGVKPLTPAEVATILSTPSASTLGNLLTANQASVETDLTGWSASTNASIARSTSTALHGSASLVATCTAASGNVTWALTSGVGNYASVVVGGTYTGVAHVKAGVTTRNVYCYIDWRDTGNVSVGTTSGAQVSAGTSGWARIEVTGVAPAGAAYARLACTMNSAVLNDTMFMDCAGIWAGAGGLWAMPGVPITGTGRRVTHPNVDDVLVEVWDATQNRWQVAHYDSGWRTNPGWFGADWNEANLKVRRVGPSILFHGYLLRVTDSGTLTGTTLAAIPSAWRPAAPSGTADNGAPSTVASAGGTKYVCSLNYSSAGGGQFTVDSCGVTLPSVWAANMRLRLPAVMSIDSSIPTSLPGTLVSSAPYN